MQFKRYTILIDRCKECGTCLEECPEQAISRTDNNHCAIDDSQCSYCGICEEVCQTQAVKRVFSCRTMFKSLRD